jgi:hypothetical protein
MNSVHPCQTLYTVYAHQAFVSVSLKKGHQMGLAKFSLPSCQYCQLLEELSTQSEGKIQP